VYVPIPCNSQLLNDQACILCKRTLDHVIMTADHTKTFDSFSIWGDVCRSGGKDLKYDEASQSVRSLTSSLPPSPSISLSISLSLYLSLSISLSFLHLSLSLSLEASSSPSPSLSFLSPSLLLLFSLLSRLSCLQTGTYRSETHSPPNRISSLKMRRCTRESSR